MTGRPLPLAAQLILALVTPALLAMGVGAYFAELATRRALEQALGDRLCSIAQAAATMLAPAVLLLEPGDEESRVAKNAQAKLGALSAATSAERVLVVHLEGNRTLLDTKGELAIGAEYGRALFDTSELEAVRRGESAASVLFADRDGQPYKTGYAPLRDEGGQVVAFVGVRAEAAFYRALDRLRMSLALVFLLGLAVLAALAWFSARQLSVPLQALSRAAERIGQGELTTEIPRGGPAEALVLADTMRAMTRSLEEREREMQMMLAGIAHEVRNPLGGIELFGGLLREDLSEDDPRRRHVDKILKELGTLSRVVNDFLDFARKGAHQPREVELADLLEELAQVLAKDAQAAEVELALDCPRGQSALIDPDSLRRAVLNLVKNAIQASPRGKRVQLLARFSPAEVTIEVIDQGPGIPDEKKAQVFAPFFTTKQQGTGLGLALVQKAVEAHRGRIEILDAPGGGARFALHLPRA